MAAALVLIAIYATLGLATRLAEELAEVGLFEAGFALGFGLLLVAIAGLGFRSRPSLAEIAIAIGVGAVYLIAFSRLGIPEERTHLVEYGLLAALGYHALVEREANGRFLRSPAVTAMTATAILGVFDEMLQGALPSRVFDVRDIGFNVGAGVVAVLGARSIAFVRRRRQQEEGSP